MIRVVRNRGRIGKPWLVVEATFVQGALAKTNGKPGHWRTTLQISEHSNMNAALAEAARLRSAQEEDRRS